MYQHMNIQVYIVFRYLMYMVLDTTCMGHVWRPHVHGVRYMYLMFEYLMYMYRVFTYLMHVLCT